MTTCPQAKRGSCIAFQTLIGIEQEIADRSLVWIPLSDKRLPLDRLMLVRRRGPKGRVAADAFADMVLARLPRERSMRK